MKTALETLSETTVNLLPVEHDMVPLAAWPVGTVCVWSALMLDPLTDE